MPTTLPLRKSSGKSPDRLIVGLIAVLIALMVLELIEPFVMDTSATARGEGNPFTKITFE